MENIRAQFKELNSIMTTYNKEYEGFEKQYELLLKEINHFIKISNWEGLVRVDELVLAYALIDYFEDIRRVKDFHKIDGVNGMKVVAYKSYWLLRRRPLQIINPNNNTIIYANERFILTSILAFMSQNDDFILERKDERIQAYIDSLDYYLKYRLDNPRSLEMIILSFFAGQAYELRGRDVKLPPR